MAVRSKAYDLFLVLMALLCILAVIIVNTVFARTDVPYDSEMQLAFSYMQEAENMLREAREEKGIAIDAEADVNGTGLIGEDFSIITTSSGDIEAKRSAADPQMAPLMVRLYHEAGIERGDAIAIGASGSFPGALVAALSAARAMDLRVTLILSCGSSNWGANIPGFTILDMYLILRDFFPVRFVAASVGGSNDNGSDMLDEGRVYLTGHIAESGVSMIAESTLGDSVLRRMELYGLFVDSFDDYAAFINIGGADANIGQSLWSLSLSPGVNRIDESLIPEGAALCGTAGEMARRGVPVIHILNLRTLFNAYRLGYDPFPSSSSVPDVLRTSDASRTVQAAAALLMLAAILCIFIAGQHFFRKKAMEPIPDDDNQKET